VDFELSDDQQALREAAADLLSGRSSMAVVRAAMDAGGVADATLWASMVEQGWPSALLDETAGGMGFGWVEGAVLAEAVGAVVAPTAIIGHWIASEFLVGTEWASGVTAGDTAAAATHDLSSPVIGAPGAAVVVAPMEGRVMAVDLRDVPVAAERAMDLTRQLGWVHPEGRRCVEVGGSDAVERLIDLGATVYSAELLGVAQRALDLSVAYAKERVQFGKPIGGFQAIKHRCADMLVDVEGMRSATYWAAWCVTERHPDASVAASTAKLWCCDAADRVLAGAMQIHGGIGFTWEHDLHLYLKRAQLDVLAFGHASFHRSRLAGLLRARVEAGVPVI